MGWKIPGNQINISENNGITVVWDIDFIICEMKETKTQVLSVDKLYDERNQVDESYALQTDLMTPVIVAEICEGKYEVLDGKHRIYKAKMTGREEIEAHCIARNDLHKYILADEETIKKFLDKV